jgi:hypothetical protein
LTVMRYTERADWAGWADETARVLYASSPLAHRRPFAHHAHHLHINLGTQRADGWFMHGSIRQRSIGSYELRVFTGPGPDEWQRCYRSKTVRGSRVEAERELAAMVEIVGRGPSAASKTMAGELLEHWFTIASANWSPTTIRQTRSVLERQRHPHLDIVVVSDLTTARIDSRYSQLLTAARAWMKQSINFASLPAITTARRGR